MLSITKPWVRVSGGKRSVGRRRRVRWPVAALGVMLAGLRVFAVIPDSEQDAPRRANLQAVEAWTERQAAVAADREALRVWPGVLADRDDRRVTLRAEATGIEPGNAVEFVLIGQRSGHDYEALAVALALPSDIHAALEFIGIPPGAPVDPAGHRFWPRGERVWVTVQWEPVVDPAIAPVPVDVKAEDLLFNLRTDASLPIEGFVFTGSTRRPHPQTGQPVYAADAFGPNAVIALYNEPFSVMEVPRRAEQSDVYGLIAPHPDRLLPAGELLTVVLEPEKAPGVRRVLQAGLRIASATPNAAGTELKDLRFTIEPERADDPAPPLEDADFVGLLAWLSRVTDAGRDPFVTLHPDSRLPWGILRAFYRLLETVENSDGIRIEPPADNQVYYRALLPADWFRDRATRAAHPDELYLGTDPAEADAAGADHGVWEWFDEQWPDAMALEPVVQVHRQPVDNASKLLDLQREQDYHPQPAVLLVFASETLPLARLYEWMLPLREIYPTQYVFPRQPDLEEDAD